MLTRLKHFVFGRPAGELLRRQLQERLHDAFSWLRVGPTQNLERERRYAALRSSAEFIERELPAAPSFPYPLELLRYALGQVQTPSPCLYLEFGVFEGATINWIARLAEGPIYGFDSFEGLPESWRPGFEAGRFRVKRLPWVRPNVRLIKGWFSDTIPPFVLEHPEPIGFLHVDCDLYSSTRTIFEMLGPRLRPGSVIVFDEFLNYPGWQQGEHQAFMEWVRTRGIRFEYLGFCHFSQQVAVRITG